MFPQVVEFGITFQPFGSTDERPCVEYSPASQVEHMQHDIAPRVLGVGESVEKLG